MSKWAHLPNAAQIDRIFTDTAQRPDRWQRAHELTTRTYGHTAREEAWSAAWKNLPRTGLVVPAWTQPWDVIRERYRADMMGAGRAYGAASDAMLALCRWDEAGDMIDLTPPAARLLIASGNHAALLMYCAVLVFSDLSIEELV
jgi:hypothetical protein